jgi:hypothetical protein
MREVAINLVDLPASWVLFDDGIPLPKPVSCGKDLRYCEIHVAMFHCSSGNSTRWTTKHVHRHTVNGQTKAYLMGMTSLKEEKPARKDSSNMHQLAPPPDTTHRFS